jgi:hypothetical protein
MISKRFKSFEFYRTSPTSKLVLMVKFFKKNELMILEFKKIFSTSFPKFKSSKTKTTSKKSHSTLVAITYFSMISMSICKSGFN